MASGYATFPVGREAAWTTRPEWQIGLKHQRARARSQNQLLPSLTPRTARTVYEEGVEEGLTHKPSEEEGTGRSRRSKFKVSYAVDVRREVTDHKLDRWGGTWVPMASEVAGGGGGGGAASSAPELRRTTARAAGPPAAADEGTGGGERKPRRSLTNAGGGVLANLRAQRAATMESIKAEARREHTAAKEAFRAHDYARCANHLNASLGKVQSEPHLRLRARARLRTDDGSDPQEVKEMVRDASAAMAMAPRRADNYRLSAVAMTRAGRLPEAGAAYLQGMNLAPHEAAMHHGTGISLGAGRAASPYVGPPKPVPSAYRRGDHAPLVGDGPDMWAPPSLGGAPPFSSFPALLLAVQRARDHPASSIERRSPDAPREVCPLAGRPPRSLALDEARHVSRARRWQRRPASSRHSPPLPALAVAPIGLWAALLTPEEPPGQRACLERLGLAQESSVLNSMRAPGTPPVPHAVSRGVDCLELGWEDPEDDGGDEIFAWVVQCSEEVTDWDFHGAKPASREGGPGPGGGQIFAGWRPYRTWWEGAAYSAGVKTVKRLFARLRKDHAFRFRVMCRNSLGDSAWSAPFEVRTRRPPPIPLEASTDLVELLEEDAPRRDAARAAAINAPPDEDDEAEAAEEAAAAAAAAEAAAAAAAEAAAAEEAAAAAAAAAARRAALSEEERREAAALRIQSAARGAAARLALWLDGAISPGRARRPKGRRRPPALARAAASARALIGRDGGVKAPPPPNLRQRRRQRGRMFGVGREPEGVLEHLLELLAPYRETLDRLFRYCCLTGRGSSMHGVEMLSCMGATQFRALVKAAGLYDDDALGPSLGEKEKRVDVIFARANLDERPRPGTADAPADADEDDGGENLLVMKEFINALLRLADAKFGEASKLPLLRRFEEVLERYVVPYAQRTLPDDPVGELIRDARTRAILDKYRPQLREYFEHYAAADQTSADARENQSTMNLAELLFFLKEGNLFDPNRLTAAEATRIFAAVNLPDELDEHDELTKEDWEAGEGDEDDSEISFGEFCKLIARLCNCKIPEANRAGVAFEVSLDNWLGLQICPLYTRILKDKKRGLGSQHI